MAGNPLAAGRETMYGDCPQLVSDVGSLHDGADLDAESLATVTAPERHRLVGAPLLDADRTAVGAGYLVAPSLLDEPLFSDGIIGEEAEELRERKRFGRPHNRPS